MAPQAQLFEPKYILDPYFDPKSIPPAASERRTARAEQASESSRGTKGAPGLSKYHILPHYYNKTHLFKPTSINIIPIISDEYNKITLSNNNQKLTKQKMIKMEEVMKKEENKDVQGELILRATGEICEIEKSKNEVLLLMDVAVGIALDLGNKEEAKRFFNGLKKENVQEQAICGNWNHSGEAHPIKKII